MLETALGGLIVAAAVGVTYLAYHNPTVFIELWRRSRLWLLLAIMAVLIWDSSTIVTYLVLKPYVSESGAKAAEDAAGRLRIFTWTLDFVLIGVIAYMEFLSGLTKLLGRE